MARGRFRKGHDPRRNLHPPRTGRPPTPKCIPDLLRWSGALHAPEKLVEEMRRVFSMPDGPLTVDQACILRSRLEALKGDIRHLSFWADRTEGPAKQTLALEGVTRLEIVEEIVDAQAQARSDAEI